MLQALEYTFSKMLNVDFFISMFLMRIILSSSPADLIFPFTEQARKAQSNVYVVIIAPDSAREITLSMT